MSPTSLGTQYDDKIFPSVANEVLEPIIAQFNADQLRAERSHVFALVRDALVRRARDFNIVVDGVAIELSYSYGFYMAVAKKRVAQQKAEQERRAAVIRAEGESEAAKLISDATAADGTAVPDLPPH